jgi:hypothetical protein
MSEEVTAIEVSRVGPVAPPMESWVSVFIHRPTWTIDNGWSHAGSMPEAKFKRCDHPGHYRIARIPSESGCAYLKRRAELLERIVNAAHATFKTAGGAYRDACNHLGDELGELDALDSEWQRAKNA